MSERILQFRLSRHDSSTQWGFRLEGGIDVGHALVISKVLPTSVAERCGLRAGDKVVRLNRSDTQWMKHEDAKMEIIRSSNDIDFTVERGGAPIVIPSKVQQSQPPISPIQLSPVASNPSQSLWSPSVSPGASAQLSPSGRTAGAESYSYNLAANNYSPQSDNIGVSHNAAPAPFHRNLPTPGEEVVTKSLDGRVKKIQHSSYNTPMGLYSKQNASSHFSNAVQRATSGPQSPNSGGFGGQSPASGGGGMPQGAMASMKCGACGDFIKGVFVKVQGRVPMHPSCLKCAKCNIGLANVGYFYIDNRLYCELHAKQVSRPPEPGMKAVAVFK